jgi:hypothetical protein
VGPLAATGQSECGNFLARRENLHVILTCVPGGLGKYGDTLRVSAGTMVAGWIIDWTALTVEPMGWRPDRNHTTNR